VSSLYQVSKAHVSGFAFSVKPNFENLYSIIAFLFLAFVWLHFALLHPYLAFQVAFVKPHEAFVVLYKFHTAFLHYLHLRHLLLHHLVALLYFLFHLLYLHLLVLLFPFLFSSFQKVHLAFS